MESGALLVPQPAVTELQGSYQVDVVGEDDRIAVRPVKVGDRIGTMWIIQDGRSPVNVLSRRASRLSSRA